jgi:hypothetical protein
METMTTTIVEGELSAIVVPHPRDKDRNVVRVGHPFFVLS